MNYRRERDIENIKYFLSSVRYPSRSEIIQKECRELIVEMNNGSPGLAYDRFSYLNNSFSINELYIKLFRVGSPWADASLLYELYGEKELMEHPKFNQEDE